VLKQARMLVVDELGYERFPELFLEVLGARHDNSRPTVITCGLPLQQVADRYSDATVRRVVEVGEGVVIDCFAQQRSRAVNQ
jgi:DNA replication protein DnaC